MRAGTRADSGAAAGGDEEEEQPQRYMLISQNMRSLKVPEAGVKGTAAAGGCPTEPDIRYEYLYGRYLVHIRRPNKAPADSDT